MQNHGVGREHWQGHGGGGSLKTGHPLGVVAQLWVLANGLFAGALLGGLGGMLIADLTASWALGRAAPDAWVATGSIIGITAGTLAGIAASAWVLARLRGRGVDVVLMTLALVPVVGPLVGLVHVGVAAAVWVRRWRARRSWGDLQGEGKA
jgi:hypothetical protein